MSFLERIGIYEGDITKMSVDAIVNAANNTLLGGGGVDGAIHKAAGPELLDECRELGGCPTGEVRVTQAYRLPCRIIVHTVGPVWQGGGAGEPELLASCYTNSIQAAVCRGARTIAFPSVSTGVYAYPVKEASKIACETVKLMLDKYTAYELEKVWFVCFNKAAADAYRNNIAALR